jgi:hypothetical protein
LLLAKEAGGGPGFGSATKRVLLFEVKPFREGRTGKRTYLEFSECKCLEFPRDDTLVNCIDYLNETGWVVPPLQNGGSSHALIMQFEHPVTLSRDQFLALEVDLGGGAPEFGLLSRIRVSFVGPAEKQPKVMK